INEIIDAISKTIPKPVYQTKITLTINENIKVTRKGNVVSIYVSYQDLKINGDIFYKGFNMSEVLFPSKYEFTATLSRKNGSVIYKFAQPKNEFKPTFNEVLLQCNDDSLSTAYNFVINETKLYYDMIARDHFRQKAGMIDQYYTADMDITNIGKQLSAINPNAFEEAEKTQASLNSFNTMIENIAQAPFWKLLQIENFDPLMLKTKIVDIKKSHSAIQNQLNYTKSIIHELYYNKGTELYDKNKMAEAKIAFGQSLHYYPTYPPSQFFIAQIAYETNQIDEAKQEIKKLYSLKNIDGNTLSNAARLAKAIEWHDLNIAAGLLTGGKYTDALNATDKAEDFCKSIPSFSCSDTLEFIRRDCHQGIYLNYLKNADKLFTQKKFKEASSEATRGILYQEKFSKYIADNSDAKALKQKIGIDEYYDSMKKGKEKMLVKDYRAAFAEFSNATSIENDYPVQKDRLLPDLLKKSKLESLFLDIDDAEAAVNSNNLTLARNTLRLIIDDQKAYGLSDNSALSVRIENLKKSIFSQECQNVQKDYDTKVDLAIKAEIEKNFIVAHSNYSEALQTVIKNIDCDINNEIAKKGQANTEKPAQYQQWINQCNDCVKNNDYLKAIELYNKLTPYYQDNSIQDYGITHQPLHLYIASQHSGFVYYGLTWLTDAGELENAMYLLKQLKHRNVIKSTTKYQQLALARAYALNDVKNGLTATPKVKVLEYTLGDKWYSYFEKEYLKQIKKLK
ncbi:MAG TPA: hypothetical protein PLL90_10860, partial [Bacteroidales bacterium]|nr:hypothetical protein [Bacteroidales bacterium]